MHTFGIERASVTGLDEEKKDIVETIEEDPEESVAQSTGRKWKTLRDARVAKRSTVQTEEQDQTAPVMGKSMKAPLDPKFAPRPKSGRSVKSRGSRGKSAAGDPSP